MEETKDFCEDCVNLKCDLAPQCLCNCHREEEKGTCFRCGGEDYTSVMRKIMGGDEIAWLCDSCWDREEEEFHL